MFDEDYYQSYAAFLDSLVALPEGRAALGTDRPLIVEDFSKSNISYARSIDNFLNQELDLPTDEKRILRDKFLIKR